MRRIIPKGLRQIKVHKLYYLTMITGILSLIIKMIADRNPSWTESWYSNGIFPWIRQSLDLIHGIIPFPLFYVSLVALLVWVSYLTYRMVVRVKGGSWIVAISRFSLQLIGVIGLVLTCFYWLWGYNYSRSSLEDALDITLSGLNLQQTLDEYRWTTDQIIQLTDSEGIAQWRMNGFDFTPEVEDKIRSGIAEVLSSFNLPNKGKVPLRFINPKGTLLRINTAGFYWPFTGESHVDDGMYPLQWPYVIAHELFHGFGISDEGDCNFLALLACLNANSDQIKYSGLVGYWRYVASDLHYLVGDDYKEYYQDLPNTFQQDLTKIREHLDQYPDVMPRLRNMVYNSYLKSQGVSEGMKSYSRVVMLNYAWRTQTDWTNSIRF